MNEESWRELINIIVEIVIGDNEGRWADRIWSQEMIERLIKIKNK